MIRGRPVVDELNEVFCCLDNLVLQQSHGVTQQLPLPVTRGSASAWVTLEPVMFDYRAENLQIRGGTTRRPGMYNGLCVTDN